MILRNKTNNIILANNVIIANNFFKRLKGLMFTKHLSLSSALYIYPCKGIHTYFMNYNIDVLYLNINNIVISIDENIPPNKLKKFRKNAVSVIELNSNTLKNSHTTIGHAIELI